MVRKIFRIGDGLVVSLPADMIKVIELREGTEVTVEVDTTQRQIVIRSMPLDIAGVDEVFAKQSADFIEQYRPALESLANQ